MGMCTSAVNASGTKGTIIDLIGWVTPQQKPTMREDYQESIANPVPTLKMPSETPESRSFIGEGEKKKWARK